MARHPEQEAEQAYISRAYQQLDAMRASVAERLRSALGSRGGTPQAVLEREVVVDASLHRLEQLDIGDEALCFGRIDREAADDAGAPGDEVFYIGRIAVSGPDQEPLVVDWRAPVAEPFYRATGRHPMGLRLRRHFSIEQRRVTAIEDERFAPGGPVEGTGDDDGGDDDDLPIAGPGALLAAMERGRTGRMRDIVATVQAEQDEIIRAELPGILVVQGGPGTGKTAVALHRAAYLLYTHRFPLERQGVLVVGPNPVFLRYIERVLPSLGETGVVLSTPSGLVTDASPRGIDPPLAARVKSSERMVAVVTKAVRDRQRALKRDVVVPYGATTLTLRASDSAEIVGAVRRRPGTHNARRRQVETLVYRRLHGQLTAAADRRRELGFGGDEPDVDVADLARAVRRVPALVEALERMWPRLTPHELLHDLFGAPALIDLAARDVLDAEERAALHRARSASLDDVRWTVADLALIDEARRLLGPPRPRKGDDAGDEVRTYGHIVLDEAQDLTPMQLRMIARRSLSGSMTIVGDVAQATGPEAGSGWQGVLRHLPTSRPPRTVELSVNYRTPTEIMDVAGRVLAATDPHLRQPRSVRSLPPGPQAVLAPSDAVVRRAVAEALRQGRDAGSVALICAPSMVGEVASALDAEGAAYGEATQQGIEQPLSLVGIDVAKGLEFDAVVLLEPASVVDESGMRALYVALTRATKRLVLVHSRPLPAPLAGSVPAPG